MLRSIRKLLEHRRAAATTGSSVVSIDIDIECRETP